MRNGLAPDGYSPVVEASGGVHGLGMAAAGLLGYGLYRVVMPRA